MPQMPDETSVRFRKCYDALPCARGFAAIQNKYIKTRTRVGFPTAAMCTVSLCDKHKRIK